MAIKDLSHEINFMSEKLCQIERQIELSQQHLDLIEKSKKHKETLNFMKMNEHKLGRLNYEKDLINSIINTLTYVYLKQFSYRNKSKEIKKRLFK